jgi:serine/threonine protein kinase
MIGERLGSDEVLAKLGEGGMGAVYRARDTKRGRAVAIRVLPDRRSYDVLPDGRLVALTSPGTERDVDLAIIVVLNWPEELKQRVPVGQ